MEAFYKKKTGSIHFQPIGDLDSPKSPEDQGITNPEDVLIQTIALSRILAERVSHYTLCLLLDRFTKNNRVLVYFHANGEDIGDVFKVGTELNIYLGVSIIIYQDDSSSDGVPGLFLLQR